MDLLNFIEDTREVTNEHLKKRKFTVAEQLCKIYSEVSEAYEDLLDSNVIADPKYLEAFKEFYPVTGIRKNRTLVTKDDIADEHADIIIATLANLQLLGYSNEKIIESLQRTLQKVQKRVGIRRINN